MVPGVSDEEPVVPQPSDTRMRICDEDELTDNDWGQLGIGATVRMCKGKGKDGKG